MLASLYRRKLCVTCSCNVDAIYQIRIGNVDIRNVNISNAFETFLVKGCHTL